MRCFTSMIPKNSFSNSRTLPKKKGMCTKRAEGLQMGLQEGLSQGSSGVRLAFPTLR